MEDKFIKKNESIVATLLSGRGGKQYEGKEVVVIHGKAYAFPEDNRESEELLDNLVKKYPHETPTITFVPKPGILII